MHMMIIEIYNHTHMYMSKSCMFDWSGKTGDKSRERERKVREF